MATESDDHQSGPVRTGAVFEASPDAILVVDGDTGAVVDANAAAVRFFGVGKRELCEQAMGDLCQTRPEINEALDDALEAGTARREWQMEQAEGTRWVDVTVAPAENDDHLVVFLRDLTERHELEIDLRRERGLTERVLDTTPTGILVHDAAGDITMANQRAEEVLGLETSELTRRGFDHAEFDIRTVDDDPIADEDVPFARIEATGETITGEQVVIDTPTGDRIISISGAPLWDETGDFDGAVMSIQDVTSEFETKAQIREQKEHLETVMAHLPVVLFAIDTDGRFTLSRGQGLERLGLEPGELNGMDVREVYADNEDIQAAIDRALAGESVRVKQEVDGVVFDTQYRPVTDEDGTVQQVIGVSLDVTEQKEQEQQLQTLVEAIPAGVFMTTVDGEMAFVNEAAAAIMSDETGAGAIEGTQMEQWLSPAQADLFGAHHAKAIESGEPVEREHTFETPDGERTVRAVVAPVSDATGEPYAVVGVVQDITGQKERKQQLRENDAILTQLTETTDDVFWLFDDEFSELQFVNEAYEDIWGRSIEAVQENSMDFMEGVHPDDRDIVRGAIERLQNGESTDHEYRVNPKEGYGRWVWVRGEPIFDDAGNVERVAGFAQDITERKTREKALERSERQFEAVFNDPQLLVALLDTDGTVRRVNETALDHADTAQSALQGTHFADTAWWDYDDDLQTALRDWLDRAADGEYVEYEAEHPRPDGTTMNVKGTIRPVTADDGTVTSLIASARDVTERVEHKRELEQSNERLEKFAYVASHDLQEPLRTISNYVELIAEEYADDLDEEAERFVDVVVTGSERMQSMINGLLDYSRVTTRGKEFEPVDTDEAVGDVVNDLGVMLDEQGGTVEWDNLPTVEADPDQFRQLIQNLVKNALEHADDDTVAIQIRGEELPDMYRFEVEDDGPGVAENRQDKIFRIFKSGTQYQTSSQAKGIGLAICDNISQRHGGDIWVESEPGTGATFVFTIAKHQ